MPWNKVFFLNKEISNASFGGFLMPNTLVRYDRSFANTTKLAF
jgi:hypothetical protein